ncbi:MAG: hypothetical protein ACXVJT_17810 [Thermoanaerobaculia bacterium]
MDYLPGILFFTLFIGAIVFVVIAIGRQRRLWRARPAILRALASRRGYQFVENPGQPSELAPIRPLEKEGNVEKLELPAAVKGRTVDATFTLFDMYTETRWRTSGNVSGTRYNTLVTYKTLINIKAAPHRWPHFEFAVVAHAAADSMTGKLLAMAEGLAAGIMESSSRGLKHVPLPGQPGSQLYVGDAASPQVPVLRDTLVKLFEQRNGWWVGALDDSMTISMVVNTKSAAMGSLVPAGQLDRFIDESLEIERTLRARLAAIPDERTRR